MTDHRDSSHRDTLEVLRSNLSAYADGASGIPFSDLLEFARPLFQLYELDPRQIDSRGRRREKEELATLLSVLDLARLLWSYFLLRPEEARTAKVALQAAVLGPDPSSEAIESLDELLDLMEDRFDRNSVDAAGGTATSGYTLPSFWQLLEDFELHQVEISDDESLVLTQSSDLPEALANFARPLFDSVDLEDPAAIDDALTRAQAYWELAQSPESSFEHQLAHLTKRFTTNRRPPDVIRAEAEAMVRRYRDLFA